MYQKDPAAAPDSDFTPGDLSCLVPKNTGRLLDPRRTPIGLVAVEPEIGVFELEGGKIKVWRDYFDLGAYQRALA